MLKNSITLLFILLSCHQGSEKMTISDNLAKTERISSNQFSTGQKFLEINDVVYDKVGEHLDFNVAWDKSWRSSEGFDAAWIFIKRKSKKGDWHHVTMKASSSKILNNRTSDMMDAEIRIAPDGTGLMVNRLSESQGDNSWSMRVAIQNHDNDFIDEFRVLGLEMVYVSEGSYSLGTLKSINERREVLTPGAGGAPYNPFFTFSSDEKYNYGGVYQVTSENEISIGKNDGDLFWIDANIPGTNTFSGIPEGSLRKDFPKGFKGFYQMKYELSQQEYCDFLNTLSADQQENRDITQTVEFGRPISDYRNMISKDNGIFSTTRPHHPCNFLSWRDGLAYADWAGLRHMTELEFEKACRGPKPPVYREYVWGANEIKDKTNMQYVTTIYEGQQIAESEIGDIYADGNIHASMFSYRNFIDVCTPKGNFYDPECSGCRSFSGGDGGRGPVQKGIFGRSANGDRINAGATFFGAMEMGGNLQEPVVTVGHPSGRKFQGSHGDGNLNDQGEANNADWLPEKDEYAFAGRGGCWKFHENHARTADRFKGLRTNPNRRISHIGFRGVRTDWTTY